MASVKNKVVCCLLLLLIITNSIPGFYLYHHPTIEDESNISEDSSSDHSIDLRSVLWPKICFITLKKNTEHQNPNNQYQQHEYNKHLSKRNSRKCYPFDTV